MSIIDLRPIYNMPVVPEEGESYQRLAHRPLTRQEFGCDFRNAMFVKHPDSQACWQAMLDYEFASAIQIYSKYWIKTGDGREIHGWRETFKRLADAGIYLFNVGMNWYGEEENREYFEFLRDLFGEKLIGLKGDSELDGGYTGGWCWTGAYGEAVGMSGEPSPSRSRAEARAEYDHVLDVFYNRAFNHGMSVTSLGYGSHYAAEHGARMLGIEAEEVLPSDTMLWCFCRGAAKQYDLLTTVAMSAVNRWGQKPFFRDGESVVDSDSVCGPHNGSSIGLDRREWYTAYMYGANIIFFSSAHFPQAKYMSKVSGDYEPFIMPGGLNKPGPGLLEANLTPVGRLHVEGQEFAAEHPVRGVPYMPVALMLDHDHGWNPPKHLYRADEDHVWGNIPYSRGDYQIDNFFRWVYPGYQDSSYYRDERGYITNTPFGDMFEVILSNASPACLSKYRAVILLGDHGIDSGSETGKRLLEFLEGGGIVVADTSQWAGAPDGDVLLAGEDGNPVVVRKSVSKGALYLITVPGWGKAEPRHDFLKGIKDVLGGVLQGLSLVRVEGRPIFYLVNVTDKDDELILTLCNNSPDLPWEGRVTINDQRIESAEQWLGHSEIGIQDGSMLCGVPANDVRILHLKAEQSFLPLMFRDIDWRSLGVGVPDTSFQTSPARRGSHV